MREGCAASNSSTIAGRFAPFDAVARAINTLIVANPTDGERRDPCLLRHVFRMADDKALAHAIVRSDTLCIAVGGATGAAIPFYLIQLFVEDGSRNLCWVAS